jgi:crossover junction endodeoxyribonuclease RuvC
VFDETRILGVDPGLASSGLAVLARESTGPEIVWADTVRTPAELAEPGRLRLLYEGVSAAIRQHGVGTLAVERVMWGRNVGSAMSVARATGVVLLAAAVAGIGTEEYAPLEVKMAVVGVGNAPKDAVRRSLVRTHGLTGVPEEPNAVDAVAVAFCHLQQSRVRKAVRA